jgi:hypothetical protein
MLQITRAANGEVVFTVSGRRITLDLRELNLADQDAVSFLVRCEAENIQLKNCQAYIREWITRERDQS